ncbi:MAG: 4-(cytidine 5'-diphospho)-2-C-methyl-D-erythritol kinase, partial [Myxococcales bacterium]|nr:4-(cytidine 5'-diphospho)-2-C-methyl-D-erythritol kinase [Myxococcales bacterium]
MNLFLRVLRRRRDGFHSIETVFHTIGLWDELHLVPGRGSGLTSTGLPTPRGPRNLCVKACRLLQRHIGSTPQARIHLIKRIPSGAGLGGGSADAAACLTGLNRLWRLNLTRAVLHRLAAQLGSDV